MAAVVARCSHVRSVRSLTVRHGHASTADLLYYPKRALATCLFEEAYDTYAQAGGAGCAQVRASTLFVRGGQTSWVMWSREPCYAHLCGGTRGAWSRSVKGQRVDLD